MPATPAARRRNQFAVTAAGFIGFMGFTLVMPFLPLYLGELGVRDVGEIAIWAGLSLGVTPAMTAALSPLWGLLADRFGRKIMVERSLLSFVVVMAAMAYATQAWHVFALRALQGLFAGYGALTLTMAVESAQEGREASAIGLVQTAQRLGPALGPVIGGLLAQLVGLRNAFLVSAGFYVVAFVLVLVLYKEEGPSPASDGPASRPPTLRALLRIPNFIALLAIIFGLQFVDRSFGPVLPLFVADLGARADRVPLIAGVLFSAIAGTAALGHHLAGRWLRRQSVRRVVWRGTIIGLAGLVLITAAWNLGILFAGMPLFGLGVGIAMTAAYTAGSRVIPKGAEARGFGVLTSASLTGLAVSPVVSGLVAGLSIRMVFGLGTLGFVGIVVLVRRFLDDPPASMAS